MKVMLVDLGTCGVNYQSKYLASLISENFILTDKLKEADKVVMMGGCACIDDALMYTLAQIDHILDHKKKDATTYLTGCITHGFKDIPKLKEIEAWLKENIDVIVSHYEPNKLLKSLKKQKFRNLDDKDFGMVELHKDFADLYIQNGCTHTCTFCKTNYLNYRPKSTPIEEVKGVIDDLDERGITTLQFRGLNLSQYGIDLDGKYKLMDLCEYIESKKNIDKVILSGVAIKDAIKGNFAERIKVLQKTKGIVCSLESGSDRILQLMKKGFTADEFLDFFYEINSIYKKYSFINIVSGFPTETIEECIMTLKVLKEIKPNLVNINTYADSPFIPSHNFERLSNEEIKQHTKIYKRALKSYGISSQINGAD